MGVGGPPPQGAGRGSGQGLASKQGPDGIQECHPECAGEEQDESPQEPPPIDPPPKDRGERLRIRSLIEYHGLSPNSPSVLKYITKAAHSSKPPTKMQVFSETQHCDRESICTVIEIRAVL